MAKVNKLADLLQKYSAEKTEEVTPTDVLPIDQILGGGLVSGGMYAFWGTPGSFKSSVAIQIAKSYCKRGDKVVMIDSEKALNFQQQETFGIRKYVEDGTFIHLTADNYQQADEICVAIANEPEDIKLVIVDSETQILPKLSDDIDVSSNQPGVKAKQGSVWLTKTKSAFFNAGITSIIICHARAQLNMSNPYGPTTKMAGGYATSHVPDAIVQFLPGQKFGADKLNPEGVIVHISTDKNKFAPPFKRVDARCYYGKAIKRSAYLIDWGISSGLIEKNGSFFSINGKSIRGTEALYNVDNETLNWLYEKFKEEIK